MKRLSKIMLIGLLPFSLDAMGLNDMLQTTIKNNLNVKSQDYNIKSKQEEYKSVSNTFVPTINIGVNYSKLDLDIRDTQVGATASTFAKFSVDLYDGGKNSSIKKQKDLEIKMAKLSKDDFIKQTLLEVLTLYFNTKTIEENIKSFEDKSKVLLSEYKRKKQKYDLDMITYDEVLKLQSEYEINKYEIDELKYQKTSSYQNLSLLVGKEIKVLDDAKLADILEIDFTQSPNIKILQTALKVLDESVKQLSSSKKPKLKLEDTLSAYNYNEYNKKLLRDLPKQQNQLLVTLSFNLYDTSTRAKKQALILAKQQKQEQLAYSKVKEKMLFELSYKKLLTQKSKISSSKRALEMAQTVFKMVESKYQNGVVDNITYLDALSKKTINYALYSKALNDYEIAKANYYFMSGVEYRDVLSKIMQ